MASKVWTFIIHPEYIHSLRHVVDDSDRYELSVAIREALEEVEDPTENATAVPNRLGWFTFELMGYRIFFEIELDAEGRVREEATDIILLPITKIEPE